MCKASRLSCTPINSHSHINDILDLSEQIVQVAVGHVERHVADKKSLCRGVEGAVSIGAGKGTWAWTGRTVAGDGILNREASAFEVLEVEEVYRLGRRLLGFELNVSKSVSWYSHQQLHRLQGQRASFSWRGIRTLCSILSDPRLSSYWQLAPHVRTPSSGPHRAHRRKDFQHIPLNSSRVLPLARASA